MSPSAGRAAAATGAGLVVAAAVLWGTTGTSQALAPDGVTSGAIATLRLVVGGAGLIAWAAVGRSGRWALPPWRLGLAGALGVALYQLCFFSAVRATGVAVGTVVAIGSAPVFAGLLVLAVDRERVRPVWVAAALLAITGNAVLGLGGDAGVRVAPVGIALALGAGASYAAFSWFAKRAIAAGHDAPTVMAVLFGGGALLLLPVLVHQDLGWVASGRGVLVVVHLGLVATTLSYVLYARGLERVSVPTATTLALAEPVTAALLGVLVLAEPLSAVTATGLGLVLGGLAVLAVPERAARRAA